MSNEDIQAALLRVERVLQRRPESGLQDDTPVVAQWEGGMRVVACHDNGTRIETDMPFELGGSGDRVSPGWLFRASLSSCLATCIAMKAAARGIALTRLDVRATSRSDTRGLLGMVGGDGRGIGAAPRDVEVHVSLSADGVDAERLHALVEDSRRGSPIPDVVEQATPISILVDVVDAGLR